MVRVSRSHGSWAGRAGGGLAILAGGAALPAAWWISSRFIVNVVNYQTVPLPAETGDLRRFAPALPWVVTLILAGVLVMRAARRIRAGSNGEGPPSIADRAGGSTTAADWPAILRLTWPAWAMGTIVLWWWATGSPGFVSMCALAIVAGCGIASLCTWGASLLDTSKPTAPAPRATNSPGEPRDGIVFGAALVIAIGLATAWQVHLQYVYWRHFALGFGDFGLFTQELEYCLPYKSVAHRFADTRMGYHAIFMFYALAPLYAVFRSPLLLMVAGPLALNVAAVAFFRWARRRTGSALIALLVAMSWLLLPSLSRMPFANQYGFQSVYLAVPWLAFSICLGLEGRWKASHVCLACAVLCEETVCGVAVGWGIYLVLFHRERRMTGIAVAAISAAYLMICTTWIIPHFAAGATYSRIDLFGDFSAGALAARVFGRARSGLYLLALAAALLPGLIRGRRLLVAIVPTLLLVLCIANRDYLNIKYWHQSTILPLLFVAGVVGALRLGANRGSRRSPGVQRAGAIGLLTTVLLMHQFLGATPLSQSYRIHLANPALRVDDPRMAAVAYVRSRYARARTRITATEMMAAHFCDFFEIRKLTWSPDAPTDPNGEVLVLDHGDGRDSVVAAGAMDRFESRAARAGYAMVKKVAGVSIWAR